MTACCAGRTAVRDFGHRLCSAAAAARTVGHKGGRDFLQQPGIPGVMAAEEGSAKASRRVRINSLSGGHLGLASGGLGRSLVQAEIRRAIDTDQPAAERTSPPFKMRRNRTISGSKSEDHLMTTERGQVGPFLLLLRTCSGQVNSFPPPSFLCFVVRFGPWPKTRTFPSVSLLRLRTQALLKPTSLWQLTSEPI